MRLKLLALVAVACLVVAGVSTANAARLDVSPGVITTATAQACTTATLTVSRTQEQGWWFFWWFVVDGYRGVRVSNIPTSCRGLELGVTGSNGSPSFQVVVPTTGSTTVEVTVPEYATNLTFRTVIDGWHVPATTVTP